MSETPRMHLLRSYLTGPKIWDAAVLQPDVTALAEQGLIEPAGPASSAAYQITPAGRAALWIEPETGPVPAEEEDEPDLPVRITIEPSWTIYGYDEVVAMPASVVKGLTGHARSEAITGWAEDFVNSVCSWGASETTDEVTDE